MGTRKRVADFQALFIVVVLVGIVVYPIVATAGVDPTGDAPTACIETPHRTVPPSASPAVTGVLTQEGEDGGVVNVSYAVAGDGEDLVVRLPPNAEWLDGRGFHAGPGSNAARLNESADAHWLTYTMSDMSSFIESDAVEEATHPSDEEWLIAAIPVHDGAEVALEPAASGYVGANTLYLGEYGLERRTVGCQTITVVIPEGTSPLFDPSARLDDLEVAAKNVPGDRHYEDVTVFVSPAGMGGVDGFVPDFESDVVIVDQQFAVHPSVLWIHEYVHTHQRDTLRADARWTIEGSANYLAYEIALENGRISPLYYDSLLGQGASDEWERSLDRSAHDAVSYARGAAVLAAIDRDLETRSNASFEDLFVWLNDHPNTGYADVAAYLREEAGLPDERVDRYESIVRADEPIDPPYAHGFSDRVPQQAWHLNVLFLPLSRLLSAGFLALLVGTVTVQFVYRRLSAASEPDGG